MLDLRDLDAELDELRDQLEDGEKLNEVERDRLEALEALDAELDGMRRYANNIHPTLIEESEFEDYARQLAEDIGAIDNDAAWPARCIDWKQAADELRMDYTSVSFDGDDYLVRG